MTLLSVQNLQKIYQNRFGGAQVEALRSVNFTVDQGEFLAIMGESGSGKTTLLNILATLDKPTKGEVLLSDQKMSALKDQALTDFRRERLGFVFQDYNLLDNFSLKDNILLPMVLARFGYEEMLARLMPIATKLDIVGLLDKYPYEVSGGQKQRAAVARALITHPDVLLADEPTGALDSKSTEQLLKHFTEINDEGQTILMVTHSNKAASYAKRVLFIKDGEVFHQLYRGQMDYQAFYERISDTLSILSKGGQPYAYQTAQ